MYIPRVYTDIIISVYIDIILQKNIFVVSVLLRWMSFGVFMSRRTIVSKKTDFEPGPSRRKQREKERKATKTTTVLL